MALKEIVGSEIALLRKTLKLSEGEFAERIDLADRLQLKEYEGGKRKPGPKMRKALLKLLSKSTGKYSRLKKLQTTIDERAKQKSLQ